MSFSNSDHVVQVSNFETEIGPDAARFERYLSHDQVTTILSDAVTAPVWVSVLRVPGF